MKWHIILPCLFLLSRVGCPFKVTEGTTDTCGLHFHSVTVSHPISHFSGEPKLRRCQNQPSVTATKKVCYIELTLWTQHIQSVKIDYVTTAISAGQEDTASLLSCFFVVVVVVLILSYLLQVRDSVQAPVAQRYTTTSMSDPHDAPASSSP